MRIGANRADQIGAGVRADAMLALIGDDDSRTQIGETTVQVREFAPDTMRVRANLSQISAKGWVKPEQLAVTVAAENLFGTPAQDRKVEGSLVLRPAFPAFADWPGYRFYDPQRAKDGYDETLGDQVTGQPRDVPPEGRQVNAAATLASRSCCRLPSNTRSVRSAPESGTTRSPARETRRR